MQTELIGGTAYFLRWRWKWYFDCVKQMVALLVFTTTTEYATNHWQAFVYTIFSTKKVATTRNSVSDYMKLESHPPTFSLFLVVQILQPLPSFIFCQLFDRICHENTSKKIKSLRKKWNNALHTSFNSQMMKSYSSKNLSTDRCFSAPSWML